VEDDVASLMRLKEQSSAMVSEVRRPEGLTVLSLMVGNE
jgi:hypothetical protein